MHALLRPVAALPLAAALAVGTLAALLIGAGTLVVPSAAHAQRAAAPARPQIERLEIGSDAGLAPGAELELRLFGTPRGTASVRISAAKTINVVLKETGAGDAVVGVGQPRLHAHGAVLVGAGGVLDRRVQDFGAVRGVGARVGKDVDLLERQAPPRVDAGAHADAHGVALDAQVHRLRPREVQAHGPLRLPGQQRCDGLNRQLVLAAVRP